MALYFLRLQGWPPEEFMYLNSIIWMYEQLNWVISELENSILWIQFVYEFE